MVEQIAVIDGSGENRGGRVPGEQPARPRPGRHAPQAWDGEDEEDTEVYNEDEVDIDEEDEEDEEDEDFDDEDFFEDEDEFEEDGEDLDEDFDEEEDEKAL